MCGIYGFASLSAFDFSEKNLLMAPHIYRRGPDNQSYLFLRDMNVLLGHSRLAINDLSAQGNQPFVSPSGRYTFVFNGEIYNFKFLRSYLKNLPSVNFRGDSDTEVIAVALDHFGISKSLSLFDSMHSLAICDNHAKTLTLSVDRLREKPLYYTYIPNQAIAFSSSLYSLTDVFEDNSTFSRNHLMQYLSFGFIPSPLTAYRNIRKLEPSSFISIDLTDFSASFHPYPDIANSFYSGPVLSFNDAKSQLKEILVRTCHSRLSSSVPSCLLLSGGIDSSLVASISASIDHNIESYSIGFSSDTSENIYAENVAKYLGINHTSINCSSVDIRRAFDLLPLIYDDIIADPSAIPTSLIYNSIDNYKVCLTGDGADEFFGGYNRYSFGSSVFSPYFAKLASFLMQFNNIREFLDIISNRFGFFSLSNRIFDISSTDFSSLSNYYVSILTRIPDQFSFLRENTYSSFLHDLEFNNLSSKFRFLMSLDQRFYLPDNLLVKSDKASMFSSKESRAIFLSPEVRSFSSSLPDKYVVPHRSYGSKPLLRYLLSDYLPLHLFNRPKMGFTFDMNSIRDSLGSDYLVSLIDSPILYQLFGDKASLIEDHLLESTKISNKLDRLSWNLFILLNYFKNSKSLSLSD